MPTCNPDGHCFSKDPTNIPDLWCAGTDGVGCKAMVAAYPQYCAMYTCSDLTTNTATPAQTAALNAATAKIQQAIDNPAPPPAPAPAPAAANPWEIVGVGSAQREHVTVGAPEGTTPGTVTAAEVEPVTGVKKGYCYDRTATPLTVNSIGNKPGYGQVTFPAGIHRSDLSRVDPTYGSVPTFPCGCTQQPSILPNGKLNWSTHDITLAKGGQPVKANTCPAGSLCTAIYPDGLGVYKLNGVAQPPAYSAAQWEKYGAGDPARSIGCALPADSPWDSALMGHNIKIWITKGNKTAIAKELTPQPADATLNTTTSDIWGGSWSGYQWEPPGQVVATTEQKLGLSTWHWTLAQGLRQGTETRTIPTGWSVTPEEMGWGSPSANGAAHVQATLSCRTTKTVGLSHYWSKPENRYNMIWSLEISDGIDDHSALKFVYGPQDVGTSPSVSLSGLGGPARTAIWGPKLTDGKCINCSPVSTDNGYPVQSIPSEWTEFKWEDDAWVPTGDKAIVNAWPTCPFWYPYYVNVAHPDAKGNPLGGNVLPYIGTGVNNTIEVADYPPWIKQISCDQQTYKQAPKCQVGEECSEESVK